MRRSAFILSLVVSLLVGQVASVLASEIITPEPTVYVFGREDCAFCKKEFKYIFDVGLKYEYLDIDKDAHALDLYQQLIEKHSIGDITPVTVVGETVLIGYSTDYSTGKAIREAVEKAKYYDIRTIEDHLARAPKNVVVAGGGCKGLECESNNQQFIFSLPSMGIVDLQRFSLVRLSIILGFWAGFSLWVLWLSVTSLALLAKVANKKNVILLAVSIVTVISILHNILLQSWYLTWDFVSLFQSDFSQAYLKIIELNRLSFFVREGYFLLHTVSYCLGAALVFSAVLGGYLTLCRYGGISVQKPLFNAGIILFIMGALIILIPKLSLF